ncbi:DUF6603 domain-containing protein [Kibdelosporangium aridum]|uniref:Galactose oxidase, central domain n=1 Tax=Kibdelosporangium aridum TaxID=2030 RepID=A0A1W2FYZ0_KIBAR|nr:DUF6603 domain-containing protein [Kibdelosporangium aridum]SMD26932.1 Galactose oxidase, central domain [Kibdelosporangium aridum]
MAGTVEKIAAEVGKALVPLRDALESPQAFSGLLRELGWSAEVIPQPIADLGAGIETLAEADDPARVLHGVQSVINGIRAIANAPDSAIPEALRVDGFREKFPKQLLDYLIVTYLHYYQPVLGSALQTLGIVKTGYVPPAGNRPSYTHVELDIADIPRVLSDPSGVLKDAFGWGEAGFDFAKFAAQVDNLLMAAGVSVNREYLPEETADAVQSTERPFGAAPVRVVKGLLFEHLVAKDPGPEPAYARIAGEVRLVGLPGEKPGIVLLPYFSGEVNKELELAPGVTLIIRSDLDLRGGVALQIRPGEPIKTVVGFENEGTPGTRNGSIEIIIQRGPADGEPILILGSEGGTRLQYRQISGTGGVRLDDEGVDVYAEFELQGLEFVLSAGGGADGFIAKILPGGGFTAGADVTIGLSYRDGFYLRGTSELELQIPTHIKIGPVEVQALTISVSPSGDGVPIGLGANIKAQLGPITAVVEQIGLTADFRFTDDGSLGPLDLDLGFKPPKGVGLSVDAGIVSGGGYLYFDPDRGEYAGALELEFAGLVALKAIGLITTRMPDGKDGFSLLIVIAAEFGGGGVQLGFGFTLLGVGGVLGLNRRMDFAALVEGVVNGSIESVMFPQDVIANAPRIISDLRRFFPPEDGRFLVGPMAKIGWGTPALVTVSLGVIVEIPPGNIAILGVLKCVLPNEHVPLLVLQVNFIGALEVDKSRLWFFAKMFDSRILTMTIDGGMGLLVDWSDNPDFVLSVGGFHPSFRPPPLPFPVPPRLSVDILNSPGRLIRVSGYFAVTSNTVQFGAKAELRLGFSDFGIEGHLAFDALFRFSPFAFIIEISAGVSLKAFGVGLFGIDLRFTLEGPSPWRAHGRGSISLLFFEISADFDISWGEERNTTLPPVEVLELLETEIRKVEGWQTRLPAGGFNPLVSLRKLDENDDLVLHPLGTLFIHQRAIPLDVRIDRVGAQRPSDGKRFSVIPLNGSGLERASITGDKFAMAQFQDMDDATKLSRPAYEDQDAGLELTADKGAIDSPRVVRRSARYELHVIDNESPREPGATTLLAAEPVTRTRGKLYRPPAMVFNQMLEGSSTARSPLSRREARLLQPFAAEETVRVIGDRFIVAYLRNNSQAFPPAKAKVTASSFRSAAAATDALADWVFTDADLAGQLHVIRQTEVRGGAVAEPGKWSLAATPKSVTAGTDPVLPTGGKVLVAGATTAVYDPITATWEPDSAPLATPRSRHSTTRLRDGRVVAAGGLDANGRTLNSVEVLSAGAWTTTQSLKTARSGHSAVMVKGQLMVIGGTSDRGAALASAELLNPDTLEWTETTPMHYARTGHQTVLFDDGKIMVIGGALPTGQGDQAMTFCEIYDPVTRSWTQTGSLLTPRKGHQATLLDGNRVLVTGGDAVPGIPYRVDSLASAEIYDLADGKWQPAGDMPGGGRSGHRSFRTRAGVLVFGGAGRPRAASGARNCLLFNPTNNTWTVTGPLATGRWDIPAVVLADGRVLAVGGRAQDGLAATAEIYLP